MRTISILFTILVFSSCLGEQQDSLDKLIELKLNDRKNKFMLERMADCRRRLMSQAQSTADSIIRLESKIQKFDSIPVPYDTFKPTRPAIAFPEYKSPILEIKDSLKN